MTAPSAFGQGPDQQAIPLWQRVWLDAYPCDVPSSLPYPNIPVSGLLETTAQRFPERAACSLFGRVLRYRELADRARRFARALAELGAQPGRRVGMLLPNIPEYLVASAGDLAHRGHRAAAQPAHGRRRS